MNAHTEIQYVSNEEGQAVSVIVPIKLWQEIASERETAYLLKSETMKQRLLEAKNRTGEFRLKKLAYSVNPGNTGQSLWRHR